MEVEGVDGMDAEPESAHASESEEAMESSEGNGAKSQDVQDELVEASQDVHSEPARSRRTQPSTLPVPSVVRGLRARPS